MLVQGQSLFAICNSTVVDGIVSVALLIYTEALLSKQACCGKHFYFSLKHKNNNEDFFESDIDCNSRLLKYNCIFLRLLIIAADLIVMPSRFFRVLMEQVIESNKYLNEVIKKQQLAFVTGLFLSLRHKIFLFLVFSEI